MIETATRALPNGLIFIEDIAGGEPPDPVTDDKVQFTSSCISVVCLHEIDGETELTLGFAEQVKPNFELNFDGTIETPSREIRISTVEEEVLLRARVPDIITRIRVWRNHPVWPDQVVVGWG
ncbi:MAG TPA: hypothetical protein VHC00_15890 [Rhizobiaceae bacterium]|nr:hypothetical protein [Rhizobiaceae bacterium]